ncbi:RND transporter, partial [Halorubrum ezzemoulense]|nr:RND transporter [Halorubrum ezzemoulense]
MSLGERIEAWTRRLNDAIVDSPRRVIIIFLVLTLVFTGGIGLVSTDTEATDSFTDGLEEQQALDAVNEEFEDPFESDDESTQLIHSGSNVLTKEALLRDLRVLEEVESRDDLRVASANGPATVVAQTIDPSATTAAEQRRVLESTSATRVRQVVRSLSENPRFTGTLATDFNPASVSASASITVISHDVPGGFSDGDLQEVQTTIRSIAADQPGDLTAFGSGVTNAETANVIG